MGCLEPNKNISEEAKKIIKILADSRMRRGEIAQAAGFTPPLVSRKLRELEAKELVTTEGENFLLTAKGKEALTMLD